jgi:hypothetical protein
MRLIDRNVLDRCVHPLLRSLCCQHDMLIQEYSGDSESSKQAFGECSNAGVLTFAVTRSCV